MTKSEASVTKTEDLTMLPGGELFYDKTPTSGPVYDEIYAGAHGYDSFTLGDMRTRNALAYCCMRELYRELIFALPEGTEIPFLPELDICKCSDEMLIAAKKVLDETIDIVAADADGRFKRSLNIVARHYRHGWGPIYLQGPLWDFEAQNPVAGLLHEFYNESTADLSDEEFKEGFVDVFDERIKSFYEHFNEMLGNLTKVFGKPRREFGNEVLRSKFVKLITRFETGKPLLLIQQIYLILLVAGNGIRHVMLL